jgi:hydrogenase nickel incorporation protein HypA/HybF
MHEISVMQGTLDAALQAARDAEATQIHCVRMRVGDMTGVVPEALQFAFEALSKGTMAEGAHLKVERVPATCWCANCQVEFEAMGWLHECPNCKALSAELRRGLELELASMEVT